MTTQADTSKARLIVVTGLSGSGKSIALNVLEDAGYYCIDNLPVSLFESLAREMSEAPVAGRELMAIGIDARTQGAEFNKVPGLVAGLRDSGVDCEILYLYAEDQVLIRRFSETRRRHPLTNARQGLEEAIRLERELLRPLMDNAKLRIDTSSTTLHELRAIVRNRVAERDTQTLSLQIQSFGFKHGTPRTADFVFDVRCLPNPHWEAALRPLTGRDAPVISFLENDIRVGSMTSHIREFLVQWIPCFEAEGRSYLTVAIGCTGGQHRSVYLSEQLARFFEQQGRQVLLTHRELP